MTSGSIDRRTFVGQSAAAGAALALSGIGFSGETKRVRVGVIGCGSVSNSYLPHLTKCPHAEVVSLCDIRPERAEKQAKQFKVTNHYPHIDKMLGGVPFDLLVNLTDMQEHERLNVAAIDNGKHVWSEKPIANSLGAGQQLLGWAKQKGVRLWGAPTDRKSVV